MVAYRDGAREGSVNTQAPENFRMPAGLSAQHLGYYEYNDRAAKAASGQQVNE
jgi:hypothetical protein